VWGFSSQALVLFKKYMPPPSSLLQGKHLPFSPSPLRLNMFRLFVILSLTQLYRYTPEIFLFSTATFKYNYRAPLRRIGQEYSANVAFSTFKSLKRIQSLPVCASCNNVAPVTKLCLGGATKRSHSSQWSKK
jgi:hypothetical protein